jgi:hypothetical protein
VNENLEAILTFTHVSNKESGAFRHLTVIYAFNFRTTSVSDTVRCAPYYPAKRLNVGVQRMLKDTTKLLGVYLENNKRGEATNVDEARAWTVIWMIGCAL